MFEDRLYGWWLEYAQRLVAENDRHCGYLILSIVCVVAETLGSVNEGRIKTNRTEHHFSKGLEILFPDIAGAGAGGIRRKIYKQVRNGLMHGTTTLDGIVVDPGSGKMLVPRYANGEVVSVAIDPYAMFPHVSNASQGFIERLRDPKEARLQQNFEKWFDHTCRARGPTANGTSAEN